MELDLFPDFDTYVEKLVEYIPVQDETFDIIISTGGLSGYYASGILSVIAYMQKVNKIKINKIYCGSAGVYTAIPLILSTYYNEIKLTDFIIMFDNVMKQYNENNNKIVDSLVEIYNKYLPEDAYRYCNNKLYIYKTKLPFFTKEYICEYKNNKHLLQCTKASSTVPYITTTNLYEEINGEKYIDAIQVPTIKSDPVIKKIYINLLNHSYDFYKRMYPVDKNIHCLVLQGIMDGYRFFRYNRQINTLYYYKPSSSIKYIKWFGILMFMYYLYKNIKYIKNRLLLK